jgi:hypothetical protein
MKKAGVIFFVTFLFAASCVSHKTLTNLDSLSEKKRNAYLKAVAKEVVVKYGTGYYRDYKEPVISRGQVPPQGEINTTGENAGRFFYHITYQYDKTKENLGEFAIQIGFWEDTGEPLVVSFGNGWSRLIPDNFDWRNDNTIEPTPYQQNFIFPLYDWQHGKDEINSEPVNKDEIIKRGFEKQPDGTWVKIHPDVPPKY